MRVELGSSGGRVCELAVLLLTFHTANGHFILTEDGVTQEFNIPDEQTARLMFWVERDESQNQHISKEQVREHPLVTREQHHYITREQQQQQDREQQHISREQEHYITREQEQIREQQQQQQDREHPHHITREQEQQIREQQHHISTEQHQQQQQQVRKQHAIGDNSEVSLSFLERNVHINLTYIVSVFQYPTLHLVISERSRWLSAHFYHDRVNIPSADIEVYPTPPSWWGRKVIITSSEPVYWYLCQSPYSCDPGSPLEQVQVIRSHVGSGVKCDVNKGGVLVVTLSVLVVGLTLLSLALTVILCYHRHHHSNTQPHHPVPSHSTQPPVTAPSSQYPVTAPSPQSQPPAPSTQSQHPARSPQLTAASHNTTTAWTPPTARLHPGV
ncbi:hypothetical protein Pmani_001758 [Petrolisthes manimaculis]|uniref:Uncharacterized protein n=1 Tax=Petrolisthes manimaculis TaxID=1843537 RepID=A0AAE1QJZ2_9EUCA|nr:hypothetical protein Pmani_001758 [Petrolisthes manimaculis]